MLKNVSGQKIGAQLVSATDGSEFTGSVTVYVTGDAGTQAAGSVGSGACTHEGHGYHTYAPAQAETNYDLVAFTFVGTGAVTATVQVFTLPELGATAAALATVDDFLDTEVAAIKTKTDFLPSATAGASGGLLIAGSNAATTLASLTITGQLGVGDGVVITCSTTNKEGLNIQSNGTGAGVVVAGGGTGVSIDGFGGNGMNIFGDAGIGLYVAGTGASGHGVSIEAGSTTATGLKVRGGTTSGAAVALSATSGAATIPADLETIKTQAVTCSGGVTIPAATLASTTNVTAGTITTVTNLTNAPTAGDFTATMKTSIGTAVAASAVASVTGNVGGNVTGSVGSIATGGIAAASFAAGAIDAAAIAANAIGASELAADAVAEIADAVWDEAQSGHTSAGTFGKYLDAQVSTVGGGSLTEAGIADAVWDEILSGHAGVGSTGAALSAAGGSGDPWSTALPGAYGAGTAGHTIGTYIDAAVSSRMATYTQPTGFLAATFPGTVASTTNITGGTITTVTTTTNLTNLPAVTANWLTAAGLAADAVAEIQAGLSTLDAAGVRTAVGLATANLDTQLAAIDDYLDTEVAAIKAKTDALPGDPADASDIAASFVTVNATLATIAGYIDTEVAAIYSRLGAPAGASLAADLAAVKADSAAILDDTGTAGVVVASGSKTGYSLAAAGIDAVVIETGVNARQALALLAAAEGGVLSGAATSTIVIKGAGVATTRVTATVDGDGNRSAITLNLPS